MTTIGKPEPNHWRGYFKNLAMVQTTYKNRIREIHMFQTNYQLIKATRLATNNEY
jgi:hypothetical protein